MEKVYHIDRVYLGMAMPWWLRGVLRFSTLFCWIIACWIVLKIGELRHAGNPEARDQFKRRIWRKWTRGFSYIIGLRVSTIGTPPPEPFFLVSNHISWQDYFAAAVALDMYPVLQAEDRDFPFVGTMMASGLPFFHDRRDRASLTKTSEELEEALRENKKSIVLTPEGVVGPGREVRRFHAALFEPVVKAQKPVHYMCITCFAPEGVTPRNQKILFGPDLFMRGEDGKILPSEIEAWGPEKMYLPHLLRLTTFPWHEFELTFGEDTVIADNRYDLANTLHDKVEAMLKPIID